jgi:hypothetical protein
VELMKKWLQRSVGSVRIVSLELMIIIISRCSSRLNASEEHLMQPAMYVRHTVTAMTSDNTVTMPLYTSVTHDTPIAFVIPLVAMLTSPSVMWCKERFQFLRTRYTEEHTFPILLIKGIITPLLNP